MGLILFVLGWGWGIWLADTLPQTPVLVWGLLALTGALGWFITLKTRGWRVMFAILTAFGLGGLRLQAAPRTGDIIAWNDRGGLTIHGEVVAAPDIREARTLVVVQVKRITVGGVEQSRDGRVLIHAPRETQVRFGDAISATGLLVTPPVIDSFDYRDYLGRSGVGSLLINVSEFRVVNTRPNTSSTAALLDVRSRLGQAIVDTLPQPSAGVLVGILLGDDRWIAPQTNDMFNQSGAGHVLVVSGYNMTLVAGAVMVILGRIRRIGVTPRLFIIWGLIIGYAVLVGGEPSTIRAAWMAGLAAFAQATGNPMYLPLSAAFSVLMQTAYDPQLLWDKGFQLSLAATGGMAFILTPLKDRWHGFFEPEQPPNLWGQLLRGGLDLLLTTVSILLFTLPLLTSASGEFSWATLSVNMLIVPAQAFILMIGAIAVIVSLIYAPVGLAMLWLVLPLLGWTQTVVMYTTVLPHTFPLYIPPWLVLVYWGVIGGVALLNDSNGMRWHRLMKSRLYRGLLAAVGVLGLVSIVLWGIATAQPDGQLHVWFLDVGARNAVLIRTPNGGTIMVDGGDAPVRLSSLIGERLPANTQHLDLLVLSAPDETEAGAWTEVARRYPPTTILTHGQPNLGVRWQSLIASTTELGSTFQTITADYSLQTNDGVIIEVIWPNEQPVLDAPLTASSLVLRVQYGDLDVLLPANLDGETQAILAESLQDLGADILLLPQHAAARSLNQAFLQAVNPSIVIAAAGLNRPPDTDVLARLSGRTFYQTGANGTLHLTSDGRTFSIQPERE